MVCPEIPAWVPEREEHDGSWTGGQSGRAAVGRNVKPEEQSRQQLELAGWPVIVESYRLGDVYCDLNADLARITRADG